MGTGEKRITLAIIGVVVGLALLFSLNQPGGPTSEVIGVVQTSGFIPGETNPPAQLVTVRLAEGAIVQAEVPRNIHVSPGQTARLRVYRRVITGTAAYEVMQVEGK